MKKIILLVVVVCTALIISSCKKQTYFKESYTDLRFDKDTVNLMITSESNEFSIDFYKSNDAVPDEYTLVTPSSLIMEIVKSTAEVGTHFTFPTVMTNSQKYIRVEDYDSSRDKGSIKIKVYPKEIKESLQITLKESTFPHPTVTINLIPADK